MSATTRSQTQFISPLLSLSFPLLRPEEGIKDDRSRFLLPLRASFSPIGGGAPPIIPLHVEDSSVREDARFGPPNITILAHATTCGVVAEILCVGAPLAPTTTRAPPSTDQSTHDSRSGATSIFVLRACRHLSRGLKRHDAEIGEERVTSPTAPRNGRQRHVRVQTVGLVRHLSQTHVFVSPTSCSRPQEEDEGKALRCAWRRWMRSTRA